MEPSTTETRVEQAAYNNAVWCDIVCRTHGKPGEFLDRIWLNRHEAPPFYPNVVTLKQGGSEHALLAAIQDLPETGIGEEWALKDSFADLNLAPYAFRPLLEAQWIWRAPELPLPDAGAYRQKWSPVRTPSELANWEAAWNGESRSETSASTPRLFLPALLQAEDVAIFAAYESQNIKAGAIANRTGNVVGLSNLFVPADRAARYWAGCLSALTAWFPGLPIVGYEGGAPLVHARSVGFKVVGPLRVWLAPAQ